MTKRNRKNGPVKEGGGGFAPLRKGVRGSPKGIKDTTVHKVCTQNRSLRANVSRSKIPTGIDQL